MEPYHIQYDVQLNRLKCTFYGAITYKILMNFLEELHRINLFEKAKIYLDFSEIDTFLASYSHLMRFKKFLHLICYDIPEIKIALVGPRFDSWDNVLRCENPSDLVKDRFASLKFFPLNSKNHVNSWLEFC